MTYPLIAEKEGIKIKPEHMEKEKLYHCIFNEKVILVYKDSQDVMNCFEIEEKELVDQIKQCKDDDDRVEKIFEDYIQKNNLKH
ncbi:MAG: hypothetical protein IH814_00615 [Thaumarchaeota archaeon]|nr:hypothetical protein [Nitrososphaerota archaeon]